MVEQENSIKQTSLGIGIGTIRRWLFRLIGIGLALGAMVWANESTLRTTHVLNSTLAAIVVLCVFCTEILLVREAKAPLNPMTLLINVAVLFFPLMNIALYSWPLAVIIIAVGILIAWFAFMTRQVILFGKNQ